MTNDPECIGEHETLLQAARKMRDLEVGALPIRGEDDSIKGVITDRDIVIRCLAEDRDPGIHQRQPLVPVEEIRGRHQCVAVVPAVVVAEGDIRRGGAQQPFVAGRRTDVARHRDDLDARSFRSTARVPSAEALSTAMTAMSRSSR
jgi:hypothetical protein